MGCSVDTTTEPAAIAFTSPAPGASFVRDVLDSNGALVAEVGIALEISGDVARVGVAIGEAAVGDADAAGALPTQQFGSPGPVTLIATAYDDAGAPLTTATVDFMISEPQVASCQAWLDMYKLEYTVGPANPGVADPVTVKLPLNGVSYRYSSNAEPRKTLYGDCALMKSLAKGASIMRAHDVTELIDMGVYNYRCIDQTKTPPNCTMSQHAYAKAIDIAGFMTSDNTKYSVLTDWVIDSTATCSAETEAGKDTFLHDVICALKDADVWNIVLTPNYNSAHRNHFHVDLTTGSDFIERTIAGADHATDALVFGD